ncbi:hypothetical protein CVT25_001167, partial [Psilocybe cyanescens]
MSAPIDSPIPSSQIDYNLSLASNSMDDNFSVDALFGDDAPDPIPSKPSIISSLHFTKNSTPLNSHLPSFAHHISTPSVAIASNTAPTNANPVVNINAQPTSAAEHLNYPSLPTIAHPGVRRIAFNKFSIFDPTYGFTKLDAQQVYFTSTQELHVEST